MISRNPSPPIPLSVRPSLQSASESPPLPLKSFSSISRDAGPSLAQNCRVFNALDSERKPRYAVAYPRLLNSSLAGSLQSGTSTLLRSATPQCGVLHRCVPEVLASLLISFSDSSLFFYYLASFFILISPCPVKHYNKED